MLWHGGKNRPILDPASGNINLHGRSGLTIGYREQSEGVFLDLTARVLFFEIDGIARFALTAGEDPTTRLIVITPTVSAELPLDDSVFACVRDESTSGAEFTTWAGHIRAFAYNAVPA